MAKSDYPAVEGFVANYVPGTRVLRYWMEKPVKGEVSFPVPENMEFYWLGGDFVDFLKTNGSDRLPTGGLEKIRAVF
jgi:hypothetical protein